ncbi:MAG TPA: superoxide dismutase family protein [Labilithrix sp.]|nr:superoxide dismutase family protein [Labilithrix sp.]
MRRATLATAIFFTSALAIAGACANKDDKAAEKPFDPDALPPFNPEFDDDAATERRAVNVENWPLLDPGGEERTPLSQVVATLQSINGSRVAGTVRLNATRDGIVADLALTGLVYLSKYTVRIHMLGNCGDKDGSGAGPGFNFAGSSLQPDDPNTAGLLGEIQAELGGEAKGEANIPGPSIRGPYSILGRSLVVHAAPDGLPSSGDPTGQRIACGVIGAFAEVANPVLGDQ